MAIKTSERETSSTHLKTAITPDKIADFHPHDEASSESFPWETTPVRILFGLEAQGHIPTIEAALKDGVDWEEIGRRIMWDGQTARIYYERHLARMVR
jgi:hypothetical protein